MQVESGHLADVDWNEGVLRIQFRSGAGYEYSDVPQGGYPELISAPSKSEFFRSEIKGVYDFVRMG